MISASVVVAPILQLDEGSRHFAPLLVGLGDHGSSDHRRVAIEHILDFQRRNVFATGDDHVLGAILDLDVAIAMDDRQIAGMEPATFKGFSVAFGFFR
jgi:hypothetical protein